jgi:hypothetical protein
MKTHIDMFETYKGLFMASKRLKNRFKKYWGTTTVDGVEVFNKRLVVWPGTDSNKNVVKILKMFGMYANIKQAKFEGITSYYLWLNPAKMDDYSSISKDIVVNHLNDLIPNELFEYTLNYTDPDDPKKFNGWASEDIGGWLLSNYATLRTSNYMECRGSTHVAEAVGYYIPLDVSGNFSNTVVSATVTPIVYATNKGITAYRSGVSVTFAAKQISPLQADDVIVDMMLNETDPNRRNKVSTAFGLDADTDDDSAAAWLEGGSGGIFRGLTSVGTGKTDKLWYRGYLRTAVLDSSYVDRDKFADILTGSIDTGYTKKKTKWWKKLLSIAIVVIAVVLSVVSAGGSLSLLATNLGISALVLTLIQFAIAQSDPGWAQYMGKFVQVVGIASIVAGIGTLMQNISARIVAAEAAKQSFKEMVTAAAEDVVKDFAKAATKLADNVSLGNTLGFLGTKVMSAGRMLAEKLMDMRVNTAMKELNDTLESVQQSKEELAELTDKEMHIGVEDIKYYTSPLKLDNLPFEVDYLYEGTKYNICRPSFVPTGLNIIDK